MFDFFDKNLWEKWANSSFEYFNSLAIGSKIAIMLPSTENLILLVKEDSKISVIIDDKNNFEFPYAEIGFKFEDGVVENIFAENNFNSFLKFLNEDKIGLLSFVSENELNRLGYSNFLRKIGFKLKNSCSCGCC